jgi:hypothetical protein
LFCNHAFEQFALKKIKFNTLPTNPKNKNNEELKTKSIELRIRKKTDEAITTDGGFIKETNSKDVSLARRLSIDPGLSFNQFQEIKLPNMS